MPFSQIIKATWWRLLLVGLSFVLLHTASFCLRFYAYHLRSELRRSGIDERLPAWTKHLTETYGYNDDIPFKMASCLFLLFVGLFLWSLAVPRDVSAFAFLAGYTILWSGIAAYGVFLLAAGTFPFVVGIQAMHRPQNMFTYAWTYGSVALLFPLLGLLVYAIVRYKKSLTAC